MLVRAILTAIIAACVPSAAVRPGAVANDAKPRLLVLTDIGGDPDDQQSLVRLMLYSNEFEIAGLIASASGTPGELNRSVTQPHLIREIVDAYGQTIALPPGAGGDLHVILAVNDAGQPPLTVYRRVVIAVD